MKRERWIVYAGLVLLIGVCVFLLDIPHWKALDMGKLNSFDESTTLYDRSGRLMVSLHAREDRNVVRPEEIPPLVKNAFIAIEDARFYSHHGVDWMRVFGALISDLKSMSFREGGSTITQQLIKLTHLSSEKSLSRKAQEAYLALKLERKMDKESILAAYLNTVYLGHGTYGIQSAARVYFDKEIQELSLAEAAALAAIVKSPSAYAPHLNPEACFNRRNIVITAMEEQNMVSHEDAEKARSEPLNLAPGQRDQFGSWYADYVLDQAAKLMSLSVDDFYIGGYRIDTTLDLSRQGLADRLFTDQSLFPSDALDGTSCQSAMVCLDPSDGSILSIMGGRSYDVHRGLNRATQSLRQPGSTFKPISVYAAAVDLFGCTPVTLLRDEERDFGGGYRPGNAGEKQNGIVTLRQALARSMNLATMDLLTRTGVDAAWMYATRAGIPLSDLDRNLSIALGSLHDGVSPLSLCAAYCPLANGGYYSEPYVIRRILDKDGQAIYTHEPTRHTVMRPESAAMLTSVLSSAATWGTAAALSSVPGAVAGKTGTVAAAKGNRDIWTVAFTPSEVVTVWMGFDQTTDKHVLPEGTTGSGFPARLAARLLESFADQDAVFVVPDTLKRVELDGQALMTEGQVVLSSEYTPPTGRIQELLPLSQVPTEVSDLWNPPERPVSLHIDTDPRGGVLISLFSLDPYVEYRIMREQNGNTELVAALRGRKGALLTARDEPNGSCDYWVQSVHVLRQQAGMEAEAEPSERIHWSRNNLFEVFPVQEQSSTPAPAEDAALLPLPDEETN